MLHAASEVQGGGGGLPLPGKAKLRSRDIDEVQDHMSRVFCPHDLYIRGGNPPIDFRHHSASLKTVSFNATDYGNPYGDVFVDISQDASLYLVQFTLSGVARIAQGDTRFEMPSGHMCVLDPAAGVRQRFEPGFKHFTVKLAKEGVHRSLSDGLGFNPGDLCFSPLPVPLEGEAQAFARLVRMVCEDSDLESSAFAHDRAVGALEQTFQRLLLAAVPHNHSDRFNAPFAAPAPYYVRRVEQFIHQHSHEPLKLEDMIAVSGVSARSLHAGFRRFRGVTPMKYLKNRRLDVARRKLLSGPGGECSVTQVALSCGFSHLSKFARDYQQRFGERPSETVLRINQDG